MHRTFSKLAIFGAAFAVIIGITVLISGQPAFQNPLGVPDDWTHHHLVFSNPGTAAEALGQGRFEQWYRTVNNPRYIMQQMKRNPAQRALGPAPDFATLAARLSAPTSDLSILRPPRGRSPKQTLTKDWSQTLGTYSPTPRVGGQYPAKFTFNSAAACSDYVVYTTGGAASTSTATVIAYYKLYGTTGSPGTGCGATTGVTVPTIYWAYNTSNGTAASATLSPVISWEGDQVAYVQSTSTAASLVILRWTNSGGSVASPVSATYEANSAYKGCAAPCYTTIAFSNSALDTNSPPFYDYAADTLYVGDNSGYLHQFTNVFLGTPAETHNSTTPWVQVKSTTTAGTLTGPVLDANSPGDIYVGDSTGYLWQVTTGGAVTESGHLSASGSTGIVDGPLVDTTASASKVYAFVGDTDSVIQFSTGASFTSGGAGISEGIGSSATGTKLYAGAFDNTHYTGSGTTGYLYVCGYHSTGTTPRLFQIAMNSNFTGAVTNTTTDPGGGTAVCSPVTEFYTGSIDWIFLSVTASGSGTGCSTACLYNYNVTGSLPGNATAGLAVTSGASGTIIDNATPSETMAGASEIYFYSLAAEACPTSSSGCAVQASQAAP